MRSDTHTINGLLEGASDTDFYIGIRVYIRHVDESETEITDGTSVAIAHIGSGVDGIYTISASWDCPETALASTDAIKVDVRCLCGVAWDEEVAVTIATFITEQLVATQLDANEWTVYYRIRRDHYTIGSPPFQLDFYDYYFRFGIDGDDSYITGFKWTSGVTKSWHNISTWNFNLTTRKWLDVSSWNFNVSSRQWLNVASWTFNLTTMAWHTIATWSFDLISKAWNNIAQWSFQTITRTWQNIIQWEFSLISLGWHTITYWTFQIPNFNNKHPNIIHRTIVLLWNIVHSSILNETKKVASIKQLSKNY